jgi:ATP-binding cassette, subfamily B, multidrug efflux pump
LGSLKRIFELVPKYWVRGLLALFSLLLGTGSALIIPYVIKRVIDGPLATGEVKGIVNYVYIIVAVAVVRGLTALLQTYCTESLAQSVVFDLRNNLYNHLQRLSFKYYDKVQTGELMSRLTADVETLRMVMGWGMVNFLANMVMLVAIFALLLSLDWRLTLVAAIALPFVGITVNKFGKKARPAYRALQAQVARLTSFLQENISGIRVVKAFGQEQAEIYRFTTENKENLEKNVASSKIFAFYFPLINLLSGLGVAAVLGVGGARVANGQLTLGTLVAFNTYLTMLLAPIRMFGWVMNMLQRASASCERIFEVLDTDSAVTDLPGAKEFISYKGTVEFQTVSFEYVPGQPVLKEISFRVEQGETVGVVGLTGSGKTTLINLIPRFYDPNFGKILLDGRDLREYTLNSLRQKIGLVMQDTFLFSATIRENIAYGRPDLSLEEIREAAKGAAIADFIETLPDGYDTVIGERGMGLSGGQKQRIAMARALALKPAILIFDDSTSSVDAETEHRIEASLEEIKGQATVFIVAQRFSMIKQADRILVLDEGEIVEQGTHQELIAREGLYRQMFEMQLD